MITVSTGSVSRLLFLQRLHNPRGPREGVVYAIDGDGNTVGTKAIDYVLYYYQPTPSRARVYLPFPPRPPATFVASSMALVMALRTFPSSIFANPEIVQPPGVDTCSRMMAGC